jgi:hypothetical protein
MPESPLVLRHRTLNQCERAVRPRMRCRKHGEPGFQRQSRLSFAGRPDIALSNARLSDWAPGDFARTLIAATCICLSACTLPGELASTEPSANPNSVELTRGTQQTNEPAEKKSCAKLSALQIGMTTSQVLLSCEREPLHTSEVIIRGGKKETIWAYWGSYLHFADGKLTSVQDVQ